MSNMRHFKYKVLLSVLVIYRVLGCRELEIKEIEKSEMNILHRLVETRKKREKINGQFMQIFLISKYEMKVYKMKRIDNSIILKKFDRLCVFLNKDIFIFLN